MIKVIYVIATTIKPTTLPNTMSEIFLSVIFHRLL
jgi:hypothetical protein